MDGGQRTKKTHRLLLVIGSVASLLLITLSVVVWPWHDSAQTPKPLAVVVQPKKVQRTQPVSPVPSDFTLQDKIGQLLMVGVTGKTVAIDLEQKYQIGGFLLMTGADLFGKPATDAVRQAGQIAPLFAIDQEGGEVSRLPDVAFRQDTAAHLGTLPDTQVQQAGQAMGQAMASIGAYIDFAPVVDLDDGHNQAISVPFRSFSSDPAVVTQKAGAFAAGLRQAGVVPTFKHFPGLGKATGPTAGNTDTGSATAPPLAELQQSDLVPYQSLLKQSTSAVMVGNQIVPDLTDGLPASMSPDAYNLLRTTYGFGQVVFTDEIAGAKAVAAAEPTPSAAVIAALKAGADMPLIDVGTEQEVTDIIHNVAQAVQAKQLSESQINLALARVMQLKSSLPH